jgi:pilus assembly protein CpaF
MTTVHANNPRDALKRLEQMVGMAGLQMSPSTIRSQIASAITLLVHLQRLPDGCRRLVGVAEITGMEGEVVQMHDIFSFVKERTDEKGNILGHFRASGVRPHFREGLKAYGIEVPNSQFEPGKN